MFQRSRWREPWALPRRDFTICLEEIEMAEATVDVEETGVRDEIPSAQEEIATPPKKRFGTRRLAIVGAVALIAIGSLVWWLHSRHFETTDDAQVDGHFDAISTRISGTVVYINPDVENDHYVKAGTLLLELDPRDYEAELEHARANLETKEADADSAAVNVPITDTNAYSQLRLAEAARLEAASSVDAEEANLSAAQHKVDQDQATAARAERDRIRYEALVERREISRSDYDSRQTEAATTAQAVESDRATVIAEQQKIAQLRSLVVQRQAQIDAARTAPQQSVDARARSHSAIGERDQARADLHTAELNLSYTKIYAPVSGVVGRKTVELGHRVQPGQSLLMIVPVDDIWITANFKETQLKLMRPGQPVTIHVDTFGRDYKGTVEDLPGAAGPLFSLFPPENASGNYVKVVQRFPVRIRIDQGEDPQRLLRPGMSVEPSVRVR
jgi:membrane fusion protein, multidrug efflux system